MRNVLAAWALLLLALPGSARAQSDCEAAADALVATTRAAIDRYAEPDAARRDGFRPISHDFPGMGEHWINLRHAVRDAFDPARPPILLYARRGDEPVLVGAAFVAFKDAGEALPGPAFLRHAWHEHSGTLEDELFAGEHGSGDVDERFAVMVLHVWSAAPLGGGPFDVQNWRLPWLRAGFDPASASFDAARALSLLTSVDYYRDALLRNGVPHEDRRALEALLADGRASVQRVVHDAADSADVDALQAEWRALVARIGAAWPESREALDRLGADPRVHLECERGDDAPAHQGGGAGSPG